MKIALEYDDWSPTNSNFHLLEKVREHYPNFKVTMFTVPWEVRFGGSLSESTPITLPKYDKWVEAVRESPWIEVALHGLTHAPMEFAELSYDAAIKRIVIGMKMIENRGLQDNFTKIFKAPQWAISRDAKRAAEDMGFKVVEDHYYTWNLADGIPSTLDDTVLIAHGHVQDEMGNGMAETLHKLLKLPPDTEWKFLSEVLGSDRGKVEYYV